MAKRGSITKANPRRGQFPTEPRPRNDKSCKELPMARSNYCGSSVHPVNRRSFLGTAAFGATAFASNMTLLDSLKAPALAQEVRKQQKHVILLWLAGGASQLETWDPKPGRPTGGPFGAIDTNVH